jgi:hypothetical protein
MLKLTNVIAESLFRIYFYAQGNKTWSTARLNSWTAIVFTTYYVLPVNIQGAKLVLFADDIYLLVIEKDESTLHQRIKKVIYYILH